MEINVNSPAYYTDRYGIDNEDYNFFRKAHFYFLDKEYSETLKIVGILPIVAPQELYDGNDWKESVQLINNKSCAVISLRMSFEEYYGADSTKKIMLTKELILKAVRTIKSRVGFNCETFERDLNQLSID